MELVLLNAIVTLPVPATSPVTSTATHRPAVSGPEAATTGPGWGVAVAQVIADSFQAAPGTPLTLKPAGLAFLAYRLSVARP